MHHPREQHPENRVAWHRRDRSPGRQRPSFTHTSQAISYVRSYYSVMLPRVSLIWWVRDSSTLHTRPQRCLGVADEVTALLQGAQEHAEVHLPVLVDRDHPDYRLRLAVPATSITPGRTREASRASLSADQPSPSSSSALRSATKSISRSIASPPPSRLGVAVGVGHDLGKPPDPSSRPSKTTVK